MSNPSSPAPNASRWLATCPEETKDVLVRELLALGVLAPQPLYRAVAFEADLETAYRAHLALRTASRIQRVLGELPANSASDLSAAAAAFPWQSWLRADRAFAVSPILTDRPAQALGEAAAAAAVADAVIRAFPEGRAPRLDPEAKLLVPLVAHLRDGICTLGVDTAGRALHKRGWRLPGHPAVLKETLAAAILLVAGYDGSEPLLDPMCGSGTLVIEGAYLALSKAPLIHRGKDDFALEHLADFDRPLWRRVAEQARAAKRPAPAAPLFASDIRPAYVELARQTALRARVERHIAFGTASFYDLAPPAPRGLIVANLPYGERLGVRDSETLLRQVGRTLREKFSQWRAALLVPAQANLDALGAAPHRVFPLMNGALEVRLVLLGPQEGTAESAGR
jgi:putative N6-adenine-specific DNA methylase